MTSNNAAVKLSNESYRVANLQYAEKLEVLYCKVGGFLSAVPDFSMYAYGLIESSLRANKNYPGIVSVFSETNSLYYKDSDFKGTLTAVLGNIKHSFTQIDSYADSEASANIVTQRQIMQQLAQVRFSYCFLYLKNKNHPDLDIAAEARNAIKEISSAVDTIFELDSDLLQVALSDLQSSPDVNAFLDKYPEYQPHQSLLVTTLKLAHKCRVSIPLVAEIAPKLRATTDEINELVEGMISLNRPAAKALAVRELGERAKHCKDLNEIADSALFETCVRYSHHNAMLSTYLGSWVKQHVQTAKKFACPVRLPEAAFAKRASLLRFRESFVEMNSVEPSIHDFKEKFPTMRTDTILALSEGHTSVNLENRHLERDFKSGMYTAVPSPESIVIDSSEQERLRLIIDKFIGTLDACDHKFFTMRFINESKRALILKEFQISSYTYNRRVLQLEAGLRAAFIDNGITPAYYK